MSTTGHVILVGAGPGDPDLLTIKALKAIESADIIAYDKLITPEVMALIPEPTEKICVGRRALTQSPASPKLDPRVIEEALKGKTVVRLKCGDPFIFGRGGEEIEVLKEHKIPHSVIPGISAAFGAAAQFSIPLTLREVSSDITFATAHKSAGPTPNLVDWASLPRRGTLALYMVCHNLKANMDFLLDSGRDPKTPCALIFNATHPDAELVESTISEICDRLPTGKLTHAALLVVGEVLNYRG
ncbi:MAG: uroporphyrinogen-III C-methyltransferase [Fibrobacterales bacterium]